MIGQYDWTFINLLKHLGVFSNFEEFVSQLKGPKTTHKGYKSFSLTRPLGRVSPRVDMSVTAAVVVSPFLLFVDNTQVFRVSVFHACMPTWFKSYRDFNEEEKSVLIPARSLIVI